MQMININLKIIDLCYEGTTNRIGGSGLEDLESEIITMRPEEDAKKLVNYGYYEPVPKSGEYHVNYSDLVWLLHKAIGLNKNISAVTLGLSVSVLIIKFMLKLDAATWYDLLPIKY